MTAVAITGGYGFLGWHTACRLRAVHGVEAMRLGRADHVDAATLVQRLEGVDQVIHVAGVNRAETERDVEEGNLELARLLAEALREQGRPINLVYANSIQAESDNAYGRGKAAAATVLKDATRASGGSFADLLLPNLFGEHGRPYYNSFVATFAHELAAGRVPEVTGDRELPLMHAQDAADVLIESLGRDQRVKVKGEPRGISEVLKTLQRTHELYNRCGEIPPLYGRFERDLFNTYRAAAFPEMWPLAPEVRSDARGGLFEALRMHGSTGQVFVSTTKPGQTRGDHYHIHKVERFCVLRGDAEIAMRRLLHDEVITFRLSGARPAYVDMPTLWTHNIRNVGETELITMFWSDQLLDPEHPDQYPEKVQEL